MSKREEMKKLRQARMKTINETDTSTPAEDAAEKAEAAMADQTVHRKDSEGNRIQTDTDGKTQPRDNTDSRKTGMSDSRQENGSAEADQDYRKSGDTGLLGYDYRASEAGSGIKHTTAYLTKEAGDFLELRSSQMGMALQDYVNMLIEEDKRLKDRRLDTEILDSIRNKEKRLKNMVLTIENYNYIKAISGMYGVKPMVVYINYLLLKEKKREDREGRRPGRYDDILRQVL